MRDHGLVVTATGKKTREPAGLGGGRKMLHGLKFFLSKGKKVVGSWCAGRRKLGKQLVHKGWG